MLQKEKNDITRESTALQALLRKATEREQKLGTPCSSQKLVTSVCSICLTCHPFNATHISYFTRLMYSVLSGDCSYSPELFVVASNEILQEGLMKERYARAIFCMLPLPNLTFTPFLLTLTLTPTLTLTSTLYGMLYFNFYIMFTSPILTNDVTHLAKSQNDPEK